jgi:choline dehydrogenase-like flavoprotein
MKTITAEAAAEDVWDWLVVGTGMGGGTFGYEMARRGQRVLFCERGACSVPESERISGAYAETHLPGSRPPAATDVQVLERAGRFTQAVDDVSSSRQRTAIPFIGAGAGGSSALYGMALERFAPADFEPGRFHGRAAGSTVPDVWPVTYDELSPFYDQAEVLYRVRGERDPLRRELHGRPLPPLPAMTPGAAALHGILEARGLHPYRLPLACEAVPGCTTCQGFLCPRGCKNDSARICLAPAVEVHGAALLERCDVIRLDARRGQVTEAVCMVGGREVRLRAERYALAAGALASPAILLRSASSEAPAGLANERGLVGRNLMRHLVDLHLLDLPAGIALDNRGKELAFTDLYVGEGGYKLGGVQSFGRLPPADVMLAALEDDMRASAFPWVRHLVRPARPLLRRHLASLETNKIVLAATLEDLPYADNAISLGPGGQLRMSYRIRDHERHRLAVFRHALRKRFAGLGHGLVKQAHVNFRLAHACGTCRLGNDPADSVVDRDCRVHALENLFVVDASVFPSSGGTNPSLTVAANAIRVAREIGGPA